ncbi:MAG: aldehyde dehydrogenase family protein [Acidimicrobiales bacterium]|jgi:aldehyde dehydrogenase (NAD+)|nr:aldehyde dehydrogenase family protein [Acidimicrobiales bacterium]
MAITERPEGTDVDLTPVDVAGIVESVRAVYNTGRTKPMAWRQEQLDGLVRMLKMEGSRFEEALALDLGKPAIEGFAADVGSTASEIAAMRKNAPKYAKPRRARLPMASQPGKGYVVPEPLGVALIVAPWNYPVQLLLLPMAAAIAAGNAVIAKPSEVAGATSNLLAELIPRYCDPEAIAVIEGDVAVATDLLEQRFDHIFYTGSTDVGRIVYQAAARHLTPVTLELGGKSPVLVDDSANIEVTGRRLAWGKWLNAGQTCVAPDYVLVTEKNRDALVDSLQSAFDEFSAGNGTKDNKDFGSIVTDRHASRLEGLLADHGGTVAFGGDTDVDAKYVEPTVIVDPDRNSRIMQEEIFGPLLPVITVESMAEAVEIVNEDEKPLALYVFAEDSEKADELITSTTSGGACVNHVVLHITPPDLPFGGVGESGTGRYHGQSGFDTFSNLKSVMKKPTKMDPKMLYPPYTAKKEKLIRRFI